MGLLEKIKNDLARNLEVECAELPPPRTAEDVPIHPFKNREVMAAKATELKNFFLNSKTPEGFLILNNANKIPNPKDFIQSSLKLMATYWNDLDFVRDRICDLDLIANQIKKNEGK